MRIGIAGAGSMAFAYAAWLAREGHAVALWSPGGRGTDGLRQAPLRATGLFEAALPVVVADDAARLAADAQVLLLAVPAQGHRAVIDALLPHLRDGQTVLVSAMSSLSGLYLAESARGRGIDLSVGAFGTTVLTARRSGAAEVRVLTRRGAVGVSALPLARQGTVLALCEALFGAGFEPQANLLASTLANTNPIAHVPLALFNWTRIERAEPWPQYHYLTPRVAAVIEQLDAERLALAQAFGLALHGIEAHFARSFGTRSARLADIAVELHAARGGPPGPTDTATRFLAEDVPYGLVFAAALGRLAGVPMPATDTLIGTAGLVAGRDFAQENALIAPLGLMNVQAAGLLSRVTR